MKFRLLTAVWGAEFCDLFVRLAARSLLAPGNFPDLSRRHAAAYLILTTEQDAERIRGSSAFAALAASGRVELQTITSDEIDPANPSSHWIIWRKGIETAKSNGEFVIYIMPDIVYGSGTLLDWAAAFDQGYRAIFTSIPEVVLETTLRELEASFPAERELPLSLDVRAVTDLCLKHLHPYHLCMLRSSRRWVPHPETVGYVVGGIAFVQRVIGSHPICFDPAFFEFNHAYVPTNRFDKITTLPSTAISLEPFLKFMPLYYRPFRMVRDRFSNFGSWFDYFTGRANDVESSRSYVFPLLGGASDPAVARAHARGNFYRAQCLAARAIFRIWTRLVELGCDRAAQILATAHYAGRLRRYKLLAAPVTVLVPSNEALERARLDFAGLSDGERRRKLLQIVHGHCFAGRHELTIGQQVVATSQGEIRAPTLVAAIDTEAAGTVISGPVELAGIILYGTDFVATPRAPCRGRPPTVGAQRSSQARTLETERASILVHPSLAACDGRDRALSFRHPHRDSGGRADYTALAGPLRRLVRNALAAQLNAGSPDEQKELADQPRLAASAWSVRALRGRFGSKLRALWRLGRSSPESARKERIRELVFANRLQEANALSADSAQVWRELAGEFGAGAKVDAALYCRRRAVEDDPDNLQLRLEWVRELLLDGRLQEARTAGAGVMQLWRILGGGFHGEGRHELMLYCRRRAVESDTADLQVRQELLRDLLVAGRFEEANVADGGLIQAWCLLGNGFFLEGQLELGLYCRRRAADLDPSDIQLRKDLVRELLLADRVPEATVAAEGLRRLWRELAGEFAAQGRPDMQRRCLDLSASTGGASAGQNAAERSFRMIQVEVGLLALRDLLKSYSEELNASRIGGSRASLGPLEYLDQVLAGSQIRLDPLKRLAQLLEQDPDFAEAWIEKAFIHYEAGQILPAVEAALRALRVRPRCLRAGHNPHPHAEAARLVALCLEKTGAFEEAITACRRSLAIDEAQPLVRICLGQLLWRQGSIEDAMAQFTKGMTVGVQMANLPDLPRRVEELSLN